jgi:serine phosphatase RsbU (regulator of sigma subunit)/predicted ATPase
MPDLPSEPQERSRKRATAKIMKRARTVQLSMLPKTPAIEGLDLFAHYAPCEAVGGDFYDFVPVSPWEIGIVMGDVAGHGVDAALTMAVAKKTIQIHGMGRSSPRETLLVTCADLAPDLPGNSFVTVFYGVLDLRDWKLTFASAGHTPPIIYNPERTPPLQSVPAKGVVMGAAFVQAMENMLVEQTLQLRKGDTLFLYTDGLTEAPNKHEDQFGEPRLLRALDCAAEGDARVIVNSVINDLKQFVGEHPQQDDLTMLAVRIAGEPKAAARVPQNKRRRVWPTNLRPAKSTFIGRSDDLAQVQNWLHNEGVLVTVTGASGLGKSRLALEAGRALLEHLPGGVWLCDCSGARDREQVAQVVAGVLGVALGNSDPLEAIAATLEFRPPLLLVLDNCESGERFARPLLERWRTAAPRCRFLVTSREAMGMAGERVLELKPLNTPPNEYEVLDDSDAASLFVARARESNPEFRLTDASRPRVASIVRGLQGNPLAIELAAAQAGNLTPDEIDEGLKRERETKRPAKKTSTESRPIFAPDAADWAYEQLSTAEKSAFGQLCLMRGGFFLEAAEAIVEPPNDEALDSTALVQSLLEKQLLQTQDTPYGTRFVLLPPIRSFGRRKRAEGYTAEQEDALTGRFVEYYANYARDQEARYASRHAPEVLDRLELDLDNIFAAQDFALAMNRPELAARALLGVAPLFTLRSPMINRIERLERTLNATGKSAVATRVRLHTALAQARFYSDGWLDAEKNLGEAIELCQPGLADAMLSKALAERGFVRIQRGAFADARADIERALEVATKAKDAVSYQNALLYSGWLAYQERRSEEALGAFVKAEPLIRQRDDMPMLVECLNSKAIVLRALAKPEDALACAHETLQLLSRLRAPLAAAVQTGNIGVIHRSVDRLDDALECFLQAESALREAGERHGLTRTLGHIADLYLFLDRLDESEACARESLALAEKATDKMAIGRANMILGHVAFARKEWAAAQEHYEKSLAIERGLNRSIESAIALAFASLCRLECGDAAKAHEDIASAAKLVDGLQLRKETVTFFLFASRACAELALKRREDAARTLLAAQAFADKNDFDHYSSDILLATAWRLLDNLRAQGLGDPLAERIIRVQCEHCRTRVRGTRKKVDDLLACPSCKTAPFRYFVDETNA